MELTVLRFDEVSSTNRVLREQNAPPGTVAVARRQTGGVGRRGKSFLSPEGGLYFSAVIGAGTVSQKLFVPIRAAVSVCAALQAHVPCAIKWPNDIVAHGKKLCGILAEGCPHGAVLGIGVNVNISAEVFEAAGLPWASSLLALTGRALDPEALMQEILARLFGEYDQEAAVAYYKKNCLTIGREITVSAGAERYDAVAVDVDGAGQLIVLREGRSVTVNAGEVSIRGREYV